VFEKEESINNKIIANINLSCMRILSYFKHNYCRTCPGAKSPLSWGYKFFNSSKQSSGYHYKQYQFLDYAIHNFDKFETELYEGVESQSTLLKDAMKPGEKLKVALTEIITDFQWDQPELFSPGKTWKRNENEGDSNLLFLFTAFNRSSSLTGATSYFDDSYQDSKSFVKCLFPHFLYNKFFNHLKIKLMWIDTGSYISNTTRDTNTEKRILIEDAVQSMGGCYIEMIYLSSWWIWNRTRETNNRNNENQCNESSSTRKGRYVHADVTSVSSLLRGLLDNEYENDKNHENVFTSCLYTLCYETDGNATIFLSSISSLTTVANEKELTINVLDTIALKRIDLNILGMDTGYFYVVNTCSNTKYSNRSASMQWYPIH
jgi:hypothetical protein